MARRDMARQLWVAQTAMGIIRRRRRREAMRRRGKGAYDTEGKTSEQVLEELIGPDWREVVLGEPAGGDVTAGSGAGPDEGGEDGEGLAGVAAGTGADVYWDEVRRVNEAETAYAKTPIATDGDWPWQPASAAGDRAPIATPESWAVSDGGWQYGR